MNRKKENYHFSKVSCGHSSVLHTVSRKQCLSTPCKTVKKYLKDKKKLKIRAHAQHQELLDKKLHIVGYPQ